MPIISAGVSRDTSIKYQIISEQKYSFLKLHMLHPKCNIYLRTYRPNVIEQTHCSAIHCSYLIGKLRTEKEISIPDDGKAKEGGRHKEQEQRNNVREHDMTVRQQNT